MCEVWGTRVRRPVKKAIKRYRHLDAAAQASPEGDDLLLAIGDCLRDVVRKEPPEPSVPATDKDAKQVRGGCLQSIPARVSEVKLLNGRWRRRAWRGGAARDPQKFEDRLWTFMSEQLSASGDLRQRYEQVRRTRTATHSAGRNGSGASTPAGARSSEARPSPGQTTLSRYLKSS